MQVFGSAEALKEVVDESSHETVRMGNFQIIVHHAERNLGWRWGLGDVFVASNQFCSKTCRTAWRKPSALFMEIGANLGMGTAYAHKAYPGSRTLSVEATPLNAFFLKWNLEATGIAEGPQATVLNRAMGCQGTIQFEQCDQARTSVASKTQNQKGCSTVDVSCASLNDIINDYDVGNITLLRQDCKGCEFRTVPEWRLQGLGTDQILEWRASPAVEAVLCGGNRLCQRRHFL